MMSSKRVTANSTKRTLPTSSRTANLWICKTDVLAPQQDKPKGLQNTYAREESGEGEHGGGGGGGVAQALQSAFY